ncbi:dephospho-CoA kinase [Aliirhizobium cellulosilyticum]|jgi:dephospho-CoA kinase|uniref:Dephospho-CoA kinase n=1 Tax=Aliirhizobium cellulosilyticum TaxID=393664 RepID=A0A7W6SCX8_9HYPH|nr:dephospho-CoA kinase [Rhizobium cellulosilyticum]MBB4351459.1 dephospho-CoA kinase [Rhizobium cellulosilyticum]MBB4414652.1 dephospho-CoA kinase [Rhizobium cellulosilyticum]MBB4449268.1 dephospho-CoA kinase [Rhizobium cellulosilyticum]
MIVIGLTGSIGMGKTTTAGMFRDAGIPVNDSDAVVHDLYRTDAVKPVGEAFPGSIREGAIDRVELARQLSLDPGGFSRLEAVVHPLVRDREKQFLARQRLAGADLVLLDIPLLFETGAEKRVDVVVVATCDPQIQRQRVLARPGMTEEKFKLILNRQMPDSQKRDRADFLVDTGCGLDQAKKRVEQIINLLRSGIRSEKHA